MAKCLRCGAGDEWLEGKVPSMASDELDKAEYKALNSLARYKFQMFGYWAAIWVHLNRITGAKRKNPFMLIVKQARREVNHDHQIQRRVAR